MEEKSRSEEPYVNSSGKMIKEEDEKDPPMLKIKVYKRRWLILALYCLFSMSGAAQWIQYSIINNIVSRYYGVSSFAIDATAMSFMGYYVLLVLPASYFVDRCGLRWSVVIGSGVSCLGSCVKIFSVAPDRFYVAFIGQSLVAFSQVIVLILPGRLAAQWFGSREISTATSLGIFGTQFGIALSFLFTPMIVKNHPNLEDIGADLSFLFWTIAILTVIVFVLVLILFKDDPKLPPSETRALQKLKRTQEEEDFRGTVSRLFKNTSYILLCNTYGLNIGVLNAVATLLNQIYLLHFENGEEDAGRIGLAMIVTGMLGSVSFGIILDKTHKFKETTVVVYFLSLCGQILFAVFCYCELKWMVYLSAIFLGYFMSGYLALGYELSAEYTYPESEGIAAGILNVANNVYGIVLVIIMGPLLESYGDTPVHIGLCLSLLIGFVMTALTKDEQRRQDARKTVRYQEVSTNEKKAEVNATESV